MSNKYYLPGLIKKISLISFVIVSVLISTSTGKSLKSQYSDEAIKKAESLTSFRSIGTIKIGETRGSFEIIYFAPNLSRSTLTLESFQIIQTFDGHKGWMKDQNGLVMELTGPDKKQLVNTGWLLGKAYLKENAIPDEVRFLKDTVIDAKSYEIYNALPTGGDSLQLFFNTKNRRIEIIGENLGEEKIFTFLADFREVEGFEMAYDHQSKSVIPNLNSSLEIFRIEVNQQFEDSLFTFSVKSPDDYYFPENSDSVVVPMVYRRGHIFIKTSINSYPAVYFILDSGAGINFLSKEYANSLDLDHSGGLPSKGISGYESTAITKLDSLKIGNINLYNQNVAIVELANIGSNLPDGIFGGLLGYDIFARFPLRIDYINQAVIFYNPVTFVTPAMEYALNLEFNMKVPVVAAEVCGVSGNFLIDLGNTLSLILHKPFVDKNKLDDKFADINKITHELSGVGGKSKAYSALADDFIFGPAHLKEMRIMVAEGEQGIIKSTDIDGNIGNGLLQNFSITFDYSQQKIYILPLEN